MTAQLIQYQYSGPGNPNVISREIHHLDNGDNLSRMKKETVFSSGKIKGFHHKHFLTAHYIPFNMLQHHNNGKTSGLGASFNRVYNRIIRSNCSDDEKATLLSNFLTVDAYQQGSRAKKLTGNNWIVYKKHNRKNYYLSLSSHKNDTDDLSDRLKNWYSPILPFLFNT